MKRRTSRTSTTTALGLAVIGIISCGLTSLPDQGSETQPQKISKGTTMDTRAVTAYNQFGFHLFNQLRTQDEGKNLFYSPLSVATALTMAYSGAAGETEQAMAQTLNLQGMSQPEASSACAELLNQLKSADPKVTLQIANSLWARLGIQFQPAFLESSQRLFKAEITTLNFSDPHAPSIINRWVDTNTKGKIKEIIKQIDHRAVMLLINAVYFKGQWQEKFNPANTKPATFHLAQGKTKLLPMMAQSGRYSYLKGERFQAIELPYGDGRVSIYLFLPDSDLSLGDFLKSLSYQRWEQWLVQFRRLPGEIQLPRFKLEYDKELNEALKALGMEIAFNPDRANFERIYAEGGLFIQQVKHKAFVEVNEEGTEAAASTSVAVGVTSFQEPFRFIADRPFFFSIRDQQTGMVLFMGVVVDPQ